MTAYKYIHIKNIVQKTIAFTFLVYRKAKKHIASKVSEQKQ